MDEEQFIRIAKALSDPTRLKVLRAILSRRGVRGGACCAELGACAGVAKATLSHHLKALGEAGLIEVEREGSFHRVTARRDVLREFGSAAASGAGAGAGKRSEKSRAGAAAARHE